MSKQEPDVPKMDLNSITFPTDQLTVGFVRKRSPMTFNITEAYFSGQLDLSSVMATERELAESVFARALDIKQEWPLLDGGVCLEILDDSYQKWGLSSGTHQSKELIREFRKAAYDQARQHMGKGPG